jgi:uncharacterized protein YdcH (DUF465 family)
MITKHPLLAEFPEYAEKIKDLYHKNQEFQVLLESYHNLDEEIFKIETNETPASEVELNKLRKDRVFIKDEIYQFLTH